MTTRRAFVASALAALPAGIMATACAGEPDAADSNAQPLTGSGLCGEQDSLAAARAQAQQRLRWRNLVDLHVGRENAHDLPGVAHTFGERAEMVVNGRIFADADAIAAAHALFGMSQEPGGLSDTQVVPEREYYTDDALLVEGRVIALHVGDVLGFVGTGAQVSLPYAALYRFDAAGKLVSERIVMNWQALASA